MQYLLTAIFTVASLSAIGCGKSPPPPTSKSEFIEASRKALENRKISEIRKLAKWDDVPKEFRDQFELVARMATEGKYEIKKIELVDVKPDDDITGRYKGRPCKLNLKPLYWLKVKMAATDGSNFKLRMRWPVGVEDGVYKICGGVWAGPQPDESKLQPHVQIGITERSTPFLGYPDGPGTINYSTQFERFKIELFTSSGKKIGTITGKVTDPDDGPDVVTIHADVKRPVWIEILGMKSAVVEPKSFDPKKIIVPTGVTKLKVTGEFEFTYEAKK